MAELPTQHDFDDFSAWTGRDVLTPDGERLGAVELIFLDEATEAPEWVLVALEEAGGSALVPLAGASVKEESIRVEQDRERVTAAPRLEVEDTITVAECRRLYDHYGLAHSQEASPTVLPEGSGAPAADEERPRLRKYVGTAVPAGEGNTDEQGEAVEKDDTASLPSTEGTGPAKPAPDATAPPAPIPAPPPRAIPPQGGFQAHAADEQKTGGPLAVLKRRPAVPITLVGGIAALIALLVLRKRR